MDNTPGEPTDPIEQLRGGDRQALAALFDQYRDRLRRMVELRLDPRLRARLDASDVVQEAFLDVARDLDAYLADPKLPPLLWLRLHVGRRLTTLHRQHLGTRMRDAGQEISLYQGALPEASSAALASMLLGRHTSPTQAAQRAERMLRVQEALNSLDPIDREVLALRHFEQLGRAEAALVLGITQEAGAKRYFRALKRLKDVLATTAWRLGGSLTMSTSSDSRDYGRFDELAEEFAERYRRGERPSLQEYIDRLPEMADEIREMFPALVEVEQVEEDARDDALRSTARRPATQQVGDYRIVREVGRGGMGVVYEAEQISLGRRVALKVLPGHVVGDRKALERFRREAKAAARLHHTNIVPVFEVGHDGDVAFYAMQFIQGQGLDQVIDELGRLRGPRSEAGTGTTSRIAAPARSRRRSRSRRASRRRHRETRHSARWPNRS